MSPKICAMTSKTHRFHNGIIFELRKYKCIPSKKFALSSSLIHYLFTCDPLIKFAKDGIRYNFWLNVSRTSQIPILKT